MSWQYLRGELLKLGVMLRPFGLIAQGISCQRNIKRCVFQAYWMSAVRQFEANHRLSVLVRRLAGLFEDDSSGPASWQPRTYLGRRRVEQVTQIYSVILKDYPYRLRQAGMRLSTS